MTSIKKLSIQIIILVFIDQLTKIIIKNYYFDINLTVIHGILAFSPIINKNLSWFGNHNQIFSNLVFLILINIFVFIIYITGYKYYKNTSTYANKYANIIFITGFSGNICSLIDKVFWGGSLDYIKIPKFFIFDLKDIYIDISFILFYFVLLKYRKNFELTNYLKLCFKSK